MLKAVLPGACLEPHSKHRDVTAEGDYLALSNDGMSEFSNSDLSLPEVCISTHTNSFEEDMNYEVQQAYRIFTGFLLDKHKGVTSPFLHPIGHQEAQHGIGGVLGWSHAQLKQSMCLQRMEEKFTNQEYKTITEFVADFRLMLENCYRYHGVDHWISKQAQKLEIMLEQKLTLLSRPLREKTTLAMTSKGRFGAEEERGSGGTSTRRRLAPRSLATITVGGHESIMVQTLRLEEQQRAKEEKRQRELEKKEAEEMSAKEVEEWEQTLLSQASPQSVDTLWELPAIGHFLCLAQTALNLPEIVFFELERCLLMPRCSLLLSKIMSSLLSPPQRRATLHRRPTLPYRRWESELRQRVMSWYHAVGASHDQPGRAEQLGLCHQFFSTIGEVSPLEEKPFHLLPFYQRVWLLKGLCDHVYETQKDVQDAVLAQPIHECRESILGYDSKENAYIHFPHFCGADLRIYCQSPNPPPAFLFPPVWVKKEPCLSVGEHSYTGRSPARSVTLVSPTKAVELKMEGESLSRGHRISPCSKCYMSKTSNVTSDEQNCCCGTSRLATQLSSESTQNSSEETVSDKIWTKKKKRKKNRGREQLLRVKGEHKQLQHVDRMRLFPAEAAKSAEQRVAISIKRKGKKKKHKTGEENAILLLCQALHSSPPCQMLVCTSLEELRELISKTEDELDDLESTKKKLGRWYYRREAVKDLHSTLIRLLNELSPWEPKLLRAYQRNRFNLFNISTVTGSKTQMDFVGESTGEKMVTRVPPYTLKRPSLTTEKGASLLTKVQTGSSNITSTADSGPQSRSELVLLNQSRDSNLAPPASMPAQTSLSSRPTIPHPTTGLPKGYTPIPTLLAKSVGNKVTLMKRPTQVLRHSGMATVLAGLPKSEAKPTQTVPKSPIQMVYEVPEGLGHQVRKDSSGPVKISVHPVIDQNTAEKIMQQVVILPSNLLIHKAEEKAPSSHEQSKGIHMPVSEVPSPLCISTNVPGFTIPENRIPIQQVAPLKDARTMRDLSPSLSTCHQQGVLSTGGIKGAQVCLPQVSTQSVIPNPFSITTPSSSIPAESIKSKDPKQELKTVCIRDSQSILVTTRGGNTGIVKVQTSSDPSALGSLPTSPVITISPQFKAFLISKTSPTLSSSDSSQTSLCIKQTGTSISVAQPQEQVPSVIKSPSSDTTSMFTAVTGSIPVAGRASHSAGCAVALSHGSNTSAGSTVATKIGQLAKTTAAGSQFQAPLVKNTVVAPSLSSSGVSQSLTQAEVISKTGLKWASTDERSQITKLILVTPSSCSTSNVALSKGTHSLTKSLTSSGVMFISQPTATSSTTFMGSIPKTLNTGLSPVSSVNSEVLSKIKNISQPSGGFVKCDHLIIIIAIIKEKLSYPAHLTSQTSVTSSFQLQGIPSFTMLSQTGSSMSTSTPASLPAGNVIRKDLGIPARTPSSTSPAQVTTAMQSSPTHSSTHAPVHQLSNIQSGEETASFSSLSQHDIKKGQMPISSATTTSAPFTNSLTGTVQQRIVINTTTPLAAGTQILLNNARFVVPPQGLGPGTHVLVISSPAPQQVPTASAVSTGAEKLLRLPSDECSRLFTLLFFFVSGPVMTTVLTNQ
uniref:Bromo domain-containing protein n=1 Tax=Anabas testudineus TaxID=64144 RepID=A0A3Q1J8N6_ANATE